MENDQPDRPATPLTHLTVDECAALLKCCPRTIVNLIQKGKLPAKNVGTGRRRNYRVLAADLDKCLGVPPPAPSPATPRRRRRTKFVPLLRVGP